MITQDLRSDKVLDLLRGYTRRQPWVKEDRVVLQDLFDTLDQANATIREWETYNRDKQTEYQRIMAQYQRRIDYLESRLKEEQNKGMWSYLKMLVSSA